MGMPIISIIVPVYNVEKYLKKCVDSILCQIFAKFELILVNDGSTDSSGAICDEYARKDNRVIIIHKKNGGLSSARNAGLDIARGQYIGFVDSDDYIHAQMYQVLIDNLLREDADISMCGMYDCYQGKTPLVLKDGYYVVNKEKAIEMVLKAKITSVIAVNKLYKSNIFTKLRYPVGKQAEDAFVIIDVLMQCKCAVITTKQLYYYYHRKNSITTKKFSNKDLDVVCAYKKNLKLITYYFPSLLETAQMRLCWAHFFVLDKMLLSGSQYADKTMSDTVNYLKYNKDFILKSNDFTLNRKLSMIILCLSLPFYRQLVQLNHNRNQMIYP